MKKILTLTIVAFVATAQSYSEEVCHTTCIERCIHSIQTPKDASIFDEARCYSACVEISCQAPVTSLISIKQAVSNYEECTNPCQTMFCFKDCSQKYQHDLLTEDLVLWSSPWYDLKKQAEKLQYKQFDNSVIDEKKHDYKTSLMSSTDALNKLGECEYSCKYENDCCDACFFQYRQDLENLALYDGQSLYGNSWTHHKKTLKSLMTYTEAAGIYTQCVTSAFAPQDYQVCASEYQNNLIGAEFALVSIPESLMSYSQAVKLKKLCSFSASTEQENMVCINEYYNNLVDAEFALVSTPESLISHSDVAQIYNDCTAQASTIQDYQDCAAEYQNNLVGAEFALVATPESLMSQSEVARIYNECTASATTIEDYQFCITEYQNNLINIEFALVATPESLMTYSQAAGIYNICVNSASTFQQYQVCAQRYQDNLVGAEFALIATPESLMSQSEVARIYNECAATATTIGDYQFCITEYQNNLANIEFALVATPESLMTFNTAVTVYTNCLAVATAQLDYQICATQYQNNLANAEFALLATESLMTYSEAANIYFACIGRLSPDSDFTNCRIEYQNNLINSEFALLATQDETALMGMSWKEFKKQGNEIKHSTKANINNLEDKLARKIYGGHVLAQVNSEVIESKDNSFSFNSLVLILVALTAAGVLYIKSKRSKSESMLARPSQVKQMIKQKMMEDQESFTISASYDRII